MLLACSYMATAQGQVLPDGSYVVTNKLSHLYWDDPDSSKQPLTNIILWSDNGGATNQRWTFSRRGDGYYRVLNKASGWALNDPTTSTTAGTALIQYPWLPVTPNAEWSVKPASGGGSWYIWSLDGGNLSSTQATGNAFYVFCAISCNKYGSEYTPISVSFNAGSSLPTYYTGYQGVASASHTYLVTHPDTAPRYRGLRHQ